MKKIVELQEERAEKLKNIDIILAGTPTDVDLKQVDTLTEEVKKLNDNIERLHKINEEKVRSGVTGTPVQTESEDDKKVKREYSLLGAIRSKIDGQPLKGLELEMHQEAQREASASGLGSLLGLGVPAMMLKVDGNEKKKNKRDMTVGTTTAGGFTVATDLGELIPVLRPRLKCQELGAKMLTGLTGNLDLPRNNGRGTASWYAENAQAAETNQTFNKISLTPKRLAAITEISKQLIAQSSINAEMFVRDDLSLAVQLAVDLAAINGSGSSNQPTGILNTAGIGSVVGGTNGLIPTWGNIIDLETQIASANADVSNMAYLTTPGVKGKLKQTAKIGSTFPEFIWEDAGLNGYRSEVSTQVPSTLTKGTSSGVAHAILFGNWNDLIIANWAGLDITIDPYSKADLALVRVTVNSWWDIALRHPESFAAMVDALIA